MIFVMFVASPLGIDKSKVTCFRCREKGHVKRECTNREATGRQDPFRKNDNHQKSNFHQIAQQPSSSRAIEDGKKKASLVNHDNEKLAEGLAGTNMCRLIQHLLPKFWKRKYQI
ncbi:putative transcription factor interactor and regulator CCHC(Zn) family [Helianthus anomalus]